MSAPVFQDAETYSRNESTKPHRFGYLAGEPATALAQEFGVHFATVFSFARRAAVPTRYRILSEEDIAVATTMYDTGQSLAAIGVHFGVANRTVLNAFRRVGVPTRGRGTNQWRPKPSR